ncbi:MAG: hypothetical protein ACXWVM_27780 [Polyangiales bacterium]
MRGALVFVLLLAGCGAKSKQYDVNVEVERIEIVRRDAQGVPIAADVTIEFGECPGQQTETFRGDKEFAACVGKLKEGDKVKATIVHEADEWGEWEVEVLEVGGCKRKPEPKGSQTDFDVVQVCHDLVSNGVKIGFRCDRKPSKELLEKCPWFRTR